MQNMHSPGSTFLPTALAVTACFLLFCEDAPGAHGRRMVRTKSAVERSASKSATPVFSPEKAQEELLRLCAEMAVDFRRLTEADVARSRRELEKATNDLIRLMKHDPNRKSASVWMERLALNELRQSLQQEDEAAVIETAKAIWNALHNQEFDGVRWKVFDGLRGSIRRYFLYQRLALVDKNGKTGYENKMTEIFDTLSETIEKYSKNTIDREDAWLAESATLLDDVSTIDPRAKRMAGLIRQACAGVNLRVRVGADFLGAGFETSSVNEAMDISENILGTRVVGAGTFSADSRAIPAEISNRAEIRVLVDSTMESVTTGYNSPVTLNTKTTGTMQGEKRIVIAEDRIFTTPARTSAQLQSSIYNVRINGGALVQCIARNQIQKRQPASKAESRRRSEMRMNQRIDGRIDQRIEELNRRYQEELRKPLLKAGLFPSVWDLSSSEDSVHWNTLVGSESQPSAMTTAPDVDRNYGLLVQVHQSALNNAAALALSSSYFDEEKFAAECEKRLKRVPKCLKRAEGVDPLRFNFSTEGPIRVLFDKNQVTVILQAHEFFVPVSGGESDSPLRKWEGLTISLTYDIKVEKAKCEDGEIREAIVLRLVGKPEYSPRFGMGKRFSVLNNPIRTVVSNRLEKDPEDEDSDIVIEPLKPEGEWKDKGTLVPVHASTKDGWLTIGWDWVIQAN